MKEETIELFEVSRVYDYLVDKKGNGIVGFTIQYSKNSSKTSSTIIMKLPIVRF